MSVVHKGLIAWYGIAEHRQSVQIILSMTQPKGTLFFARTASIQE